jgi:hypothetical protein
VLLRLAYLGVTNALAMLRLLPMSHRDKDTEILVLRHQITVLQRHLHGEKVRFTWADRALLAALLHRLPSLTAGAAIYWAGRQNGPVAGRPHPAPGGGGLRPVAVGYYGRRTSPPARPRPVPP